MTPCSFCPPNMPTPLSTGPAAPARGQPRIIPLLRGIVLLSGLLSLFVHADVLREQQRQYVAEYQRTQGALAQPAGPALAALLAQHAGTATVYDTLSARAGLVALTKTYDTVSLPMAAVINDDVDLGGHRIPVRIYRPTLTGAPGVLFFIHGGGHLSGSVEVYDPVARHLAAATGNTVIAVDYRRAPENPYPEGLTDSREVLLRAYSILDKHRIAYQRQLTLVGDSGGGAFSATLAEDFQTTRPGYINRLILIYPSLDYTLSWPSVKENGQGKLLDETKIRWYFDQYFQHGESRRAASPLYRQVSKTFPTTLLFSGGLDPLRDEDFAFVARLQALGVPVKQVHFSRVVHAYLMLESLVPEEVKATYQAIGDFVRAARVQ